MKEKFKNFLLDAFFPKFCFGCKEEGDYLCPDCKGILEISGIHQRTQTQNLSDLYFALEYKLPLLKNLLQKFKYEPFIRDLSATLVTLITDHFQLLDSLPLFLNKKSGFVLTSVPAAKRKSRRRGFNPAQEIGKELSKFLGTPLINDILMKNRETLSQTGLTGKERKENVKGAFSCQNKFNIQGKGVLLVDDIYTTGATMEECARVLKSAGAKEIIGIVIARARPEEDRLSNT